MPADRDDGLVWSFGGMALLMAMTASMQSATMSVSIAESGGRLIATFRRSAARHPTHCLAPRTREIPIRGVDGSAAVPGFVERRRCRRDYGEQVGVSRQCGEHLARGPRAIEVRAPIGDLEQCGAERSSNRFAVVPTLRRASASCHS